MRKLLELRRRQRQQKRQLPKAGRIPQEARQYPINIAKITVNKTPIIIKIAPLRIA